MPTIHSKPEDEESSRFRVPAFRQQDPYGWLEEFEGYMRRQDQAHLALTTERPVGVSESKLKSWDKKNDTCISYLQEAVRGNENRSAKQLVFKYENKDKTAKEIIDQLTQKFFIRDSRIIHAHQEHFVRMKLAEGEKASSFITRIEEANELLRRVGKILDPEVDLVGRLIAGMEKDARYKHMASALKLQSNLTWEEACRLVQADDQADANTIEGTGTTTESANAAFTQSASPTVCQICKTPGHAADKCRYRLKSRQDGDQSKRKSGNDQTGNKSSNQQGKQSRISITCYFCHKTGHKADECRAKRAWLKKKGQDPGKNAQPQESTQSSSQKRKHGWDDEPEFSGMMQQQPEASKRGRN